ncbi:MAG: DEAD/DEAH box helicase [Alphaproteobacteria bacterium]|nr:DEAD/DEAH box helicase [Alphaproteobacteria bacterium]
MLVIYNEHPRAVLRASDDFGIQAFDLVGAPRRLTLNDGKPPLVEALIDQRRTTLLPLPSKLATNKTLSEGDNWLSLSSRTLARLYATFLVAEDPQRRLDARKAATLMHQVSLVQHILEHPNLRKVLIGDEVGLGKTIEAGLIIRQLIERSPSLRVLYLAPARLVRNVTSEFREKLDIDARMWVAGAAADARLNDDKVVVASIQRAVFGENRARVLDSGPWDVVVVDECHHLSDWGFKGGKANLAFKLVSDLVSKLPPEGRLILMSGTPHQGHQARFENILRLLSDNSKDIAGASGRVIFRTKDRVRDWRGAPLFPARDIRPAVVVSLGKPYEQWYEKVGALYETTGRYGAGNRAAGWAKGQALQWAASSVHAGVGFLARLGIRRLNWKLDNASLSRALEALRPYRGGPRNEPLEQLYERLFKQVRANALDELSDEDGEEVEIDEDGNEVWRPDAKALAAILDEGVALIKSDAASKKWEAMCQLIDEAEGEKIVLFAQPVETVTLVADILEKRCGRKPSIIIGNQSDEERLAQVTQFQSDAGPQFLVSSKAGGEGLNMQKARRLIHLDVPWNPMDLEQRIGRIHRFGSRKKVIVDTVVAAGSREIDMYRIAREKLALVARNLDPEEFEKLFSRVMSLVPPKELEELLVNTSNMGVLDTAASNAIGELVTAGFKSWSKFDAEYRKQADEIRMASPGEAQWADVGAFLVKYANAKDGTNARFGTFEFRGEDIVDVEEDVPTIAIDDRMYACGDTGGLRAFSNTGDEVHQLGLNLDEVKSALRESFVPGKAVGAAFVSRPKDLAFLGSAERLVTVLAFLQQTLLQEGGRWSERSIVLRMFAASSGLEPVELDGPQRAKLVRSLQLAPRKNDPIGVDLDKSLVEVEAQLAEQLRRPTDEQLTGGVRHAVWPLAAIVLVS